MTETIEIDRGISCPVSKGRKFKYPWTKMKVNDSFLANGATIASMSNSRMNAERLTGWKFTSRTVERGVRIWRVK